MKIPIPTLIVIAMIACTSCSEQVEPIIEVPVVHKQQDTTSHDVEWEVFVLGRPGLDGSIIHDIHALYDTDVWAVGKFVVDAQKDSLGFTAKNFNAAHWNGYTWEFTNINNESYSPSSPGRGRRMFKELWAVHVFGHNDVLVSSGGELIWYNENSTKWGYDTYVHEWKYLKYLKEEIPAEMIIGGIRKMWVYSRDDIYFCGTSGSIRRRKDGKWIRIESGTKVNLNDIYGDAHGRLWTGGYVYPTDARAFVTVKGNQAWEMKVKGYFGEPGHGHTVYVSGDTLYDFIGNAILVQSTTDDRHFRYTVGLDSMWEFYGFLHAMRGHGNNNIFAAGDFRSIMHYNGKSWKIVSNPSQNNPLRFLAISLTDEYVYIAGHEVENHQGIIYRSRLPK